MTYYEGKIPNLSEDVAKENGNSEHDDVENEVNIGAAFCPYWKSKFTPYC